MVLRLSETRLRTLGFDCVTATTGDVAWDILQRRDDIDVVFTDLVMPGELSGHALAKRVAQDMPHLRILITSGFSENVLSGEEETHAFAILRKPYRQADLAEAFRSLLQD